MGPMILTMMDGIKGLLVPYLSNVTFSSGAATATKETSSRVVEWIEKRSMAILIAVAVTVVIGIGMIAVASLL